MLHNHVPPTSRTLPYLQTSPQLTTDGPGPEQPTTQSVNVRMPMNTIPHTRDASVTRGRSQLANTTPHGLPVSQTARAGSAQPAGPDQGFGSRGVASVDTGLQRRTSNSYGHHRQTSVIHGMQHSRNTSFNSPSSASPLSPESLNSASIARAAANLRRVQHSGSELSSTFTSPVSPFQGHSQNQSLDSFADVSVHPYDAAVGAPRKRTATSRTRRGHGYSSSAIQQPAEPRTPGEYALHHLFHAFVLRADQKISQCLTNADVLVTPVEHTCGPGADVAFDQLISSLGHISRQGPKPLVDSLMLWRKAKADAASSMKKQIQQHRLQASGNNLPVSLPRRHTEPVQANGEPTASQAQGDGVLNGPPLAQEANLADRRATVSVYILCRVLIAIFEQSSLVAITPDLALKLEDIVFTQLKDVDPTQLSGSSLRLANWRVYGQVLGYMSCLDFDNVTSRYIKQIEIWQRDVAKATGSSSARDLESRVELLLHAMRHIHIEASQETAYKSCEFFSAVANLFIEAHGPRIKQAYCQLLERLLLSVAGNPECFQGVPKWKGFIDTINSRLGNMLAKVRHWNSGFPLSILLFCISPLEAFSSQWQATVSSLAPKLKDKSTRGPAMQAICQLTWTYLARVSEPAATRLRRVEDIIRMAFPTGKKTHIVTEPGVAEPLVQLIRMIGFAYQDLCFRSVVFPLVNLETIQSSRDLKIEHMEPERIVIGIRGFLAIMADLEKQDHTRPAFPAFNSVAQQFDGLPTSPASIKAEMLNDSSRRPPAVSAGTVGSPVLLSSLNENAKQYYFQFCEILGKITILCDNTFGGQATLNEKFSALTPKTPLVDAFTLVRKDDGSSVDQKQAYFELLHVAIQALPRCFTDHIPLNTLINLLCTGSAHMEPSIAASATESLKAIAKQGYAQSVAIAFPRFIFNYDMQYSTMSDEGRLGPAHIESTLTLYLDLLHIWMEQLKQKTKGNAAEARERSVPGSARGMQLEMTNVIPLVDEIEAYGLFFLCSQSRRVRAFAIKVLSFVINFDNALGKEEPSRIIKVLETYSTEILNLPDDILNVAERSRLQKDKRKTAAQNTLIDISSSEVSYDATLWFKAFPSLVRHVFEQCPHAIALCRGIVCDRLLVMQNDVEAFAKMTGSASSVQEFRTQGRSAATPGEVLFDQWKLYLIMACVTLSSSGAQSQSQLANAAHSRKVSKAVGASTEKLGSARALFSAIIPMLAAGPEAIRSAVVAALGSINRKLYRTLLESLQYAVITCNDEAKARINAHHRTPSSPQRSQMTERLRTEVTHVYKLTASFLRYEDIFNDEWILNNLVNYTKDLRIYLSDTDVQNDWRFQRLRYHYCGLVEEVFEGTNRTSVPPRWMPFEARKSAFALMEDWCGYAAEQNSLQRRRDSLDGPGPFAPGREFGERAKANAAMEKDKSNLRMAALSSMAALCAGPVSIKTESSAVLSFNLPRMLSWIDTIFATSNDKMHSIGRRALKLLLLHNPGHLAIMEHAIECCYRMEHQKALESYFGVVAEVLVQDPQYPLEYWRILGTVVFTLGSENREIRMRSAHLLRTLDERQERSSNLQDFDISISDKTRAVYKLAQFEYSKRLAQAHPDLAFNIFSEFSMHYKSSRTDHQRNIVAAILPWLQTLELQVDPGPGGPTAVSYMLMANMVEITICSSSALHNEVQALWQALATGPHAGNVQLILDFIIFLCLERREQNFVEYAKQIIVYLSTTLAGSRVLDFFILQLTPKNMVNDKKITEQPVPETSSLPYVADLTAILPTGNKQAGLSLGQVALIFLVDLMVPPVKLAKDDAIKLVHAVFILWDHYTPTVQEQAREMLVHLIHELVTTKVDSETLRPVKHQIERIVDAVRKNDEDVSWSYEDHAGKDEDDGGSRVPIAMSHLAKETVAIFSLAFENFNDVWAKEALHWASICPVRHLACRSFQVFRCISVSLDSKMLADMLARLSNTIADEQSDYQTFSMEILTTLKVIIGALDPKNLLRYPQLFWTTCACLSTIHEREFFETLGMLEKLVEKIDLSDPRIAEVMLKGRPAKWEGEFEGLQPLLYKGLKSADSLDRTLILLQKMGDVPDCELIGDEDRFLYSLWANLPRILHNFDLEVPCSTTIATAHQLAEIAKDHDLEVLCAVLSQFTARRFNSSTDMLVEIIEAIRVSYFPAHDAKSLIFMMGLLTNKTPWFRIRVMEILCHILPLVDMKDSAITSHGPDLISPLLRLLQTEHCAQALEVMDYIMEVSGNPMERHHLRMSMASGSNRAIRKEYERTKSLYGIPHSSGWSIPMPAVYSSMTRHNVHAVFYTCGDSESMKDQEHKTPEVEFHQDDGYTDSYFPVQSRAATMRSIETSTDANVSDLVNTLDSLDDFFDEPMNQDSASTPTGSSHPSYVAPDLHENNANLYDEQTAPILHRSLARTSSSISFQNGLAETGQPANVHYRGQPSVSSTGYSSTLQTSFSSIDELSGPGPSLPSSTKKSVAPASLTTAPSRPGLHSRSITSPANQFPISQPTAGPLLPTLPQALAFHAEDNNPYYEDTVVSDSESSSFPPLTTTTSHGSRPTTSQSTHQITPTSATEGTGSFTISGMRRGMRRLTGGKSESSKEKEKVRDTARLRALSGSQNQGSAAGQSPRVPRVPLEYLNANITTATGPSPTTSPAL